MNDYMNQDRREIKVVYRTAAGYQSKAYVAEEEDDGLHYGTDKHSDTPMAVRWSDIEHEWIQVLTPQIAKDQAEHSEKMMREW